MSHQEVVGETPHVLLDIMRQTQGVETREWLDRYVVDPPTKKVMYYEETTKEHNLNIHRGDKTGPIIARGNTCLEKEGTTEVHFSESQSSATISLIHQHHDFWHFHGKTTFEYEGKKYHWKGHTALVDDASNTLLAVFHTSWAETRVDKLGRLEIMPEGSKLQDLVVVSALVVQERSDERIQATAFARQRALEGGVPYF